MNTSPIQYYKTLQLSHEENLTSYWFEIDARTNVNQAENAKAVDNYRRNDAIAQSLQKSANRKDHARRWSNVGFFVLLFAALIGILLSPLDLPIKGVFAVLAVALCVFLIYFVGKQFKKAITALLLQRDEIQANANAFLAEAYRQMSELNDLFFDETALRIAEKTMPEIAFDDYFTEERLRELCACGFDGRINEDECVLQTLSGEYLARPFLYHRARKFCMVDKIYHGSIVITWTTETRSSNGQYQTQTHSQTLHASVQKPCPDYWVDTDLYYGNGDFEQLCFSRKHQNANLQTQKELEKNLRSGKRRLEKLSEKSIKNGEYFMPVENADFEVLFNAVNRTDELEYRQMFGIVEQEKMLNLLLSNDGFGDNFDYYKRGKITLIRSAHTQNRPLTLPASAYQSYCYADAKQAFFEKNRQFFKSVFFDFAPLCITRKENAVGTSKGKKLGSFSEHNYQEIAEAFSQQLTPTNAATPVIFSTQFQEKDEDGESFSVVAKAFVAQQQVDYIKVHGNDGNWHAVPVEWIEYLPVEKTALVQIRYKKTQEDFIPQGAISLPNAYAYIV